MQPRATTILLAVALAAIITPIALAKSASADTTNVTFTDGTHQVGQDIPPGTYVTEIDEGICRVAVTSTDDDQRQPTFLSRAIITISGDDTVVETSGCGDWRPHARSRQKSISRQFSEGTHEIGVDMLPGIYTADGNNGRCLWFTLNDFSHHPDPNQLITWWKVGQPAVELSKDHVGFYSIRCGTWHLRQPAKNDQPLTEFADGSHLVGIDIAPGIYIADSDHDFCDWFRTAPFGGANSDNSGGYLSQGPQIAAILPTDTGFHSEGCGTWKPFADQDLEAEPAIVIGPGTHAVGIDIQPGAYVAEAIEGQLCRWFFLSGFAGRPSDIEASDTGVLRGIVEIPPDVVGFRSLGCGEWTMVQNPTTKETTAAFGDGEHIVNVHVKPGIYASPGPETGRCSWRRITGYAARPSDHVAVRNPVGKNIAEITDTDAIFKAFGCGEWQPFESLAKGNQMTEFGRGTWAVDAEISPGTYSSQVPDSSTCFWSRLSAFTGEPKDFITTDLSVGHSVMTIHHYDMGFYSDGCGTWTAIPDDLSHDDHQPVEVLQDGVYVVNRDIVPGTYVAEGLDGDVCFWSRLTSFDGDAFNRINTYASAGQAIATILDSDSGFRSFGCGTWHKVADLNQRFDDVSPINTEGNDSSASDSNNTNQNHGDENDVINRRSMSSTFSDGTYEVGVDIVPGTYITAGEVLTTCKWRRLSDFTWTSGVIIEAVASGIKIATVTESDKGFASLGCGKWKLLDMQNQIESESKHDRFGDGSYLVDVNIEPGTYVAVPRKDAGCRWSRVEDFTGQPADTITSGTSDDRWVVEIAPSDIGFMSHGCGTWRNVDNVLPLGPFQEFSDGTHRVGRDVVSNTYVANVPTQPFIGGVPVAKCKWQRISGFGHTEAEIIDSGNGKGKIEVTIVPSDAGFVSQGCGEWKMIHKRSQ